MSEHEDDPFDIEFPFLRMRVGGRGRVRFGDEDEGEVIDMEHSESVDYWSVRRRVRRRLGFVRHFFTFVMLNGLFVLLDWRTGGAGSGVNWSQWVALIWGIFLAWEFVSNFVAPSLWGRDMEERLVQRELRRRRGS